MAAPLPNGAADPLANPQAKLTAPLGESVAREDAAPLASVGYSLDLPHGVERSVLFHERDDAEDSEAPPSPVENASPLDQFGTIVTGMRLGELEALTLGDVDEQRGRWRVSAAASKTNRARWVNVPPVLFEAVSAVA